MSGKYRVIDGFDYKNEPCKLIEYIETEERYSTENDLEANSLCKLLNEQEETTQRLKTIREEQIQTILKQKRKIKALEKENEELKQENKMLKTTISRNEAYINQIKTIGKWSNTGDVK